MSTIPAENVLTPLNVCVPDKCAVSESKYALAIAVPFQVPVPIVPKVVILVEPAQVLLISS